MTCSNTLNVGPLLTPLLGLQNPKGRISGVCVAAGDGHYHAAGVAPIVGELIVDADAKLGSLGSATITGEHLVTPFANRYRSGPGSIIGEHVVTTGLGVGGGAIDVYDEGLLVKSKAKFIDIVGVDSQAVADGLGVRIYHPPVSVPSHWNTLDGTNNNTVANVATSNRYVALPTSEGVPYFSGGAVPWGGDLALHPCTRTSPLIWSAGPCYFDNANTTFSVTVSDSSGTIASHSLVNINSDSVSSLNNITITISGWGAIGMGYQATISVSLNTSALLSTSGYFSILMRHNSASVNYDKSQVGFYDSQANVFVISGTTSALNTPVTKQISGIYLLTTNTTWDMAIGDIDYPNSDSAPTNLIALTLSDFGISNTNLNSADLTGWTTDFDLINASWSDTLTTSVASYRLCGGNATFTATEQDWVAGAGDSAAAIPALLDTYTDNATNGALSIIEQFNGESQRRNSDGTAFDSTATLAADELLCFCGSLMVQQGDWTLFAPHNGTTIINPDYSGSGGATQRYYRFITTDGTVRSGGVFTVSGVAQADIDSGDIEIEISLDGTDWYTTSSFYLGGALTPGAGCRVSGLTVPSIEFTLGTFTTLNASGIVPANSVMVRVTMPNTSVVELGQLNFVWN